MSVGVRLEKFTGAGTSGERIFKLTFRGVSKQTKLFDHKGDTSVITQTVEWPIARGLDVDEKLEILLLAHNRFLNNRVVAVVSLPLHRLLDESHQQLMATMLDPNNRPIKASLELFIWYKGPGIHFRNFMDMDTGTEQDESAWEGDMSDDQRALIDIEKNIANIERSMSANQLAKTSRQQGGSTRSLDKNDENSGKRKFFISSEKVQKKRMNALRSVKNVLSMARRRSDDEDEERNLYGTSMESEITTDGEGGGETEGEDGGAERTHDGERLGSVGQVSIDGSTILPPVGRKRTKRYKR
ncbi:otoferlin [Eurytemora carolleeae]|uniref:otoferlin n=1 Tax=Eurytemora carolleeae TaxID=1294199 RepID=UPI000C75885F|nr:otoferlin [Eurytemora carolleeae]|eukprot:XP_023341789.1 otoferlin-like [Eurytemora affinis]